MEVFLSRKFNCKGAEDLNEFLWADYKKGLWNGEFLSDLLKIQTTNHGMHGLGFREYRQVATAFMEKHLKYKVDESQWNMSAILDLQAGHNSVTAGADYARATGDLGVVTREAMHQYYIASREWHGLLLESSRDVGKEAINLEEIKQRLRVLEMGSQPENVVETSGRTRDVEERMEDIIGYFSNPRTNRISTANPGMMS